MQGSAADAAPPPQRDFKAGPIGGEAAAENRAAEQLTSLKQRRKEKLDARRGIAPRGYQTDPEAEPPHAKYARYLAEASFGLDPEIDVSQFPDTPAGHLAAEEAIAQADAELAHRKRIAIFQGIAREIEVLGHNLNSWLEGDDSNVASTLKLLYNLTNPNDSSFVPTMQMLLNDPEKAIVVFQKMLALLSTLPHVDKTAGHIRTVFITLAFTGDKTLAIMLDRSGVFNYAWPIVTRMATETQNATAVDMLQLDYLVIVANMLIGNYALRDELLSHEELCNVLRAHFRAAVTMQNSEYLSYATCLIESILYDRVHPPRMELYAGSLEMFASDICEFLISVKDMRRGNIQPFFAESLERCMTYLANYFSILLSSDPKTEVLLKFLTKHPTVVDAFSIALNGSTAELKLHAVRCIWYTVQVAYTLLNVIGNDALAAALLTEKTISLLYDVFVNGKGKRGSNENRELIFDIVYIASASPLVNVPSNQSIVVGAPLPPAQQQPQPGMPGADTAAKIVRSIFQAGFVTALIHFISPMFIPSGVEDRPVYQTWVIATSALCHLVKSILFDPLVAGGKFHLIDTRILIRGLIEKLSMFTTAGHTEPRLLQLLITTIHKVLNLANLPSKKDWLPAHIRILLEMGASNTLATIDRKTPDTSPLYRVLEAIYDDYPMLVGEDNEANNDGAGGMDEEEEIEGLDELQSLVAAENRIPGWNGLAGIPEAGSFNF